jgi:hypothetical protein
VCFLSVQSKRQTYSDHYLVVAKVRERLAVSKQTMCRLHMDGFFLKQLNEIKGKEQHSVEILNRTGHFVCYVHVQPTQVK